MRIVLHRDQVRDVTCLPEPQRVPRRVTMPELGVGGHPPQLGVNIVRKHGAQPNNRAADVLTAGKF
ncbi:hypothetical protein GCM10009679_76580 [Saccharothrix algeriensis]|uniref:Uncharacterized protein n=1 Tax=Catellatospora bangladeshensis TaxID=310355 RepID=A0A8J3JK63_9ACTN|nr:hypothetical protein Cba03nite_76910 [Catellatospora bangladeshensis]